jgi:hypothetical protein
LFRSGFKTFPVKSVFNIQPGPISGLAAFPRLHHHENRIICSNSLGPTKFLNQFLCHIGIFFILTNEILEKCSQPFLKQQIRKNSRCDYLERLYLEEDLFGNGRIECTENCAVMHSFLCIWEPGNGSGPEVGGQRAEKRRKRWKSICCFICSVHP